MNNLNSLILEGTLTKDVVLSDNTAQSTIAVTRYYRNASGETVEDISRFDVIAYGNLAGIFAEHGHEGRGVRLVGRLTQQNDSICVIAEHIEFRPEVIK